MTQRQHRRCCGRTSAREIEVTSDSAARQMLGIAQLFHPHQQTGSSPIRTDCAMAHVKITFGGYMATKTMTRPDTGNDTQHPVSNWRKSTAKWLLCASGKGGNGKTSTSLNLAVFATNAGLKVCIVDLDNQRTLSRWHADVQKRLLKSFCGRVTCRMWEKQSPKLTSCVIST